MRVLVTGATGFIGHTLVPALRRDGHTVVAWVRSLERARQRLDAAVEPVRVDAGFDALVSAISRVDGIVNLAGEPLIGKRWTPERRRALETSRVDLTRNLVRAIAVSPTRPRVLVSACAVGWYGDRGDEPLSEQSPPGDDFLARLCRGWEDAATAARGHGVRVVVSRFGVVLGKGGGALAQMLPPFRLGLGGPIGSGRQFMPWIHIDDVTTFVAAALADEGYQGSINVVAPQEATNRTFTAALARALHRPAVLPVPAFVVRAIFGEASIVLLASQRVEPRALGDRGFPFTFPELDGALASIIPR
jgi:uncharacterized protein (TIGR01777 family)